MADQITANNVLTKGRWDVIVVGGGNAALVAAISAKETGANVLLIERAPEWDRGGNTKHTRNIRCLHEWSDDFSPKQYLYEELWKDLCGVGSGPSNEELASLTVNESADFPKWMSDHGVHWQHAMKGTINLSRTNRFFLGGGKALVNAYYRTVNQLGIDISYDTMVKSFTIDGDKCTAIEVDHLGTTHSISASTIVCASGGFEANLEWLRRYWGDAVDNYIVRGPVYNDGMVLQALFDNGADTAGEQKQFHAVAVDARTPRFDGGIASRIDAIPYGVALNKNLDRFYDEGEDIWPKRYAIWGRNIAEQPDQLAYAFWDAKTAGKFLPPMYEPSKADTLEGVARGLGIDEAKVVATIREFNNAIVPGGTFDMGKLDDCRTEGITPPKSHWAQPIDTAPFYGIALRPGITFTYMGVKVNREARILRTDGSSFANVFAAGEIMSGNVLSSGYMAGFGLTIGSVWGRIAGTGAGRVAVG